MRVHRGRSLTQASASSRVLLTSPPVHRPARPPTEAKGTAKKIMKRTKHTKPKIRMGSSPEVRGGPHVAEIFEAYVDLQRQRLVAASGRRE